MADQCGAVQRLQGTWEPQLDGTESAVPLHVHQRGQRDGGGLLVEYNYLESSHLAGQRSVYPYQTVVTHIKDLKRIFPYS